MFVLSESNSLAIHFLNEIRSVESQKDDPMRFRKNMERIGEVLAYEISKSLSYHSHTVQTPLGESKSVKLSIPVVLATILRSGLPFHQGFLNFFDQAENAFVASYRSPKDTEYDFEIKTDYLSSPSLSGKVLILIDPMLATGQSLWEALKNCKNSVIRKRSFLPLL